MTITSGYYTTRTGVLQRHSKTKRQPFEPEGGPLLGGVEHLHQKKPLRRRSLRRFLSARQNQPPARKAAFTRPDKRPHLPLQLRLRRGQAVDRDGLASRRQNAPAQKRPHDQNQPGSRQHRAHDHPDHSASLRASLCRAGESCD